MFKESVINFSTYILKKISNLLTNVRYNARHAQYRNKCLATTYQERFDHLHKSW